MESNSTNSKYNEVENCKIRLSDHISDNTDADLNIVMPIDMTSKYIVIGNEGKACYLWDTATIIDFIPHLIKYCNLKARRLNTNIEFVIKKKVSKFANKRNSPDIARICSHPKNIWTNDEICALKDVIEKDLDVRIGSLQKEYVKFLKETGGSYAQVMNLYKALYIDNHLPIDDQLIVKMRIAIG